MCSNNACLVQLSFSAADLRDRDVFSKSDTMLVVYIKARDGAVVEVCRTEVVLNSLNPAWITKYTIMYQFEILQTLLFRVYDVDTLFHNVDVKLQMGIPVSLIPCIILIPQEGQMHIREQSWRLERYWSFMTQIDAFLHGILEHGQLTVQSLIVST
ncbi:hypothetical protein ACOSQ3_000190 [Xanthoceras sorbifolium]